MPSWLVIAHLRQTTVGAGLSYLSQVVKVVFVVDPSVVGGQAVGLVGDVLHVEAHAVVKLAFEELRRQTHTDGHGAEPSRDWLKPCQRWPAALLHICSTSSVP